MTLDTQKLTLLLTSIHNFQVALKTQLALKLGTNDKAADTFLFEGKTLAQVTAQIQALSKADVDALSAIVTAHNADKNNPHAVTKAQVGLGLVDNFATATGAEAAAAVAADKFITASGLGSFWASKVGAAPETLDTIAEIAAALQNNPDVINNLLTSVGGKLGKTEQAADSLKLGGKTLQEVLDAAAQGVDLSQVVLKTDDFGAYSVGGKTLTTIIADITGGSTDSIQAVKDLFAAFVAAKATSAEVITGTDDVKYTTSLGVHAAIVDAIDDLKGGVATEFDTLAKIAAALGVQASDIADLTTVVDGKLGKTDKAADTTLFDGLTVAEVLAQAGGNSDEAVAAVQAALDAFIASKATDAEAVAGTDNVKYLTSKSGKAAIDAAVAALVDSAPEALNTIKELADALNNDPDIINSLTTLIGEKATAADITAAISAAVDPLVVRVAATEAAIVTLGADKLDKTGVAADSSKLGGKTLVEIEAARDAAIVAVTDPLDTRLDALEAQVGEGSDFLTATSDLGLNPVQLTGDAPARGLKVILEEHSTKLGALRTDVDAAGVAVTAAGAAAEAADVKAVAAQGTADQAVEDAAAAKAVADAALPATGTAVNSSKLEGQSLEQILATIRGGDVQTIQAVQDALDAYIATAAGSALVKATSAEAVAGTDDAKYITSLALKAKVDAAVSALVNGAPEAFDTLKELSDALSDNSDAVAALTLSISGKLGKTEQAADSAKLGGKTQADITATSAEVTIGTENDKFVTPAALKPSLDALALTAAGNTASIDDLAAALTQAFNDAATDMDPAV